MNYDATAVKDDERVEIQNLMSTPVSYIVNANTTRTLGRYQRMKVTAGELRALYTQPGGATLLREYISVKNKDLAAEFGVDVDATIEYNWTEQDIIDALTTKPIEVLLDALDFAPSGIVEELARQAVEHKIADNNRIKAISQATHYDIAGQIRNKEQIEALEKNLNPERERPARRRAVGTSSVNQGRRVKS